MEDILKMLEGYLAGEDGPTEEDEEELYLIRKAASEIISLRKRVEVLIQRNRVLSSKVELAESIMPPGLLELPEDELSTVVSIAQSALNVDIKNLQQLPSGTGTEKDVAAQEKAAAEYIDAILANRELCVCGSPHGKEIDPTAMMQLCDSCEAALAEAVDPYDGDS